jgi:PAS domain S-box-containing protein
MRRHVAQIALARHALAVLAVAVTVVFALWLRPVVLVAGQLSLVAILIVGWTCGLPPALLAWGLATLAFAYYFTPPLNSLTVDHAELPRLIIFALLGLLLATVSAAGRRAQDSLRRVRAELETRVRERTADLERSNEQLQAALAEQQGHVWLLESIDRIDRVMQTTNDLEQMMSDVLDAALSIFDCDRAWLMHPCDPEAVSHEVKMQRTRPEFPSLLGVGDEVPIDQETADMFRTVRASSGPVQFGPHSAHPLSSELAERRRVQSRIVMALYPKGESPYIFGASQCSYARRWTPREEFLFQEIGRRLEEALTSLSIFHRLRESEQRYRRIFESTGVSIWEEDFSRVKAAIDDLRSSGVRDFRAHFAAHPQFVQDAIAMVKIVDVNAASVKLFAAESKAELLVSLDRILVAERCEVFVEQLVAIAERRTLFEAETVLQTLKGELLTVLCSITFPTSAAGFDSVLATVMDITERKRAEYLAGQMFESSPDTIAIVGRDFRYRRVNPVHERVWGLPRETIVGMHLAEVLSMEFFEQRAKPKLDRCFAGEEVAGGGWIRSESGARYMSTTFSPMRPDSERVEAALVIGRDITEYVQAEEALQQARAELTHVTRVTTLGELAASIAHEVNQPLAAIVADAGASLNWLAAPCPDLERVRETLQAIAADGHRAAEVIRRIRQLATKSAPRKDPVNVNDVVRDVLSLVRAELRHHDVSLELRLAPELPAVLGDRVQLQQVSLNLVMNAIEATASVTSRPRQVTIRSGPHDRDRVRVTVEDTGVGIAAKHRDELFNAFFTTKPEGMGMGLSISRSIVEAHGGQLWATPNEPYGTIFHVSLPVGPSPLPEDVAPDSGP